MRLTVPQLKSITKLLTGSGYTEKQAGEILKSSDDNIIQSLLAGDLSSVPGVLSELGVTFKGSAAGAAASSKAASNKGSRAAAPVGAPGASSDKKTDKKNKSRIKENKRAAAGVNTASGITAAAGVLSPSVGDDLVKGSADDLQAVEGSAVPDNELPVGFGDRCCEWVEDFCNKHNLDITRLKSQQWRSACMYIGENIKASGVYRDRERERHEGGVIYSGVVLEKLLYLWAYLCGVYNQVPLASDFINFTGVSRGFFYDYDGRGLTAASVRLAQKAKQIEESGLGSSVAGGGAGAIGGMFLLKTRHGYSETVTIQHASPAAAVGVSDLPKLDIKSI